MNKKDVKKLIREELAEYYPRIILEKKMAYCQESPDKMTNQDLRKLSQSDLWKYILSKQNQRLVRWGKEVLELADVDFEGMIMWGWSFRRANLRGANLSHADLRHIEWCDANLTEVDFQGSTLTGSLWDGATVRGAIFSNAKLSGYRNSPFRVWNADFFRASFKGVDLSEVSFKNTDLREADFRGCDLRGTRFEGVQLKGALFDGHIDQLFEFVRRGELS